MRVKLVKNCAWHHLSVGLVSIRNAGVHAISMIQWIFTAQKCIIGDCHPCKTASISALPWSTVILRGVNSHIIIFCAAIYLKMSKRETYLSFQWTIISQYEWLYNFYLGALTVTFENLPLKSQLISITNFHTESPLEE